MPDPYGRRGRNWVEPGITAEEAARRTKREREAVRRALQRHPSTWREEPMPCFLHSHPDKYECPTCVAHGEEAWEATEL